MKMFGWIQCKLRKSSSPLLKDSGHGNASGLSLKPSWNDQHDYMWPKNGTRDTTHTRQLKHDQFERYLRECSLEKAQEDQFGEANGETFPGFLTIGTLDMESIGATEPTTPTFGFLPNEEASEDHRPMEEMSYDLKLINAELEKFLESEAENEGLGESRRASVASTITLSGKDKDDTASFPFQGYLLASSYDLSVSEEEADKEKASLLELFRRSREIDINSCIKVEIKQEPAIRKYKPPINPMRKILQSLQPSPKKIQVLREAASTASSPTRKRFRKIKQLFQRKVYPEGPAAVKERNKCKNEKTNRKGCNEGCAESGHGSCKAIPENKSNDTNAEHWIRTDEDYLVLELGEK